MSPTRPSLTIIGGGVAGLTAARLLSPLFETTILDKGSRLGGRCASKLYRGAILDQGAPYFALSAKAEQFLAPILSPVPGTIQPFVEKQQWYIKEGANTIGKYLLSNTDVKVRSKCRVNRLDAKLMIENSDDKIDGLILCTAPSTQAAALFPDHVSGKQSHKPCLVAALAYAGLTDDEATYAKQFDEGPLSLVVRESAKPGRGAVENETIFVVHGSDQFSLRNLEHSPEHWVPELRNALEQQWAGVGEAKFLGSWSKRWRYSTVISGERDRPLEMNGVYFAGDWVEPRSDGVSGIELAMISGAKCAQRIAGAHGLSVKFPF